MKENSPLALQFHPSTVKTTVLFLIIAVLAIARLITHLRPEILGGWSKENRTRLNESVDSLISAGVVALLLVHFIVRPFYIPSASMVPTLKIGDLLLVDKLLYDFTDPVRGDIVVFHTDTSLTGETPPLIKRVVGVAHDTIEVRDNKLILNGQALDEPFINEGGIDGQFGPITVEEGHIFCMGDNRNNSKDSRYIGQISLDRLVGRAEVIIFPPNHWRSFNFPHKDR